MSEPAISHHLRVLRMNGLVKRKRNGKEIFYQLDDDHVRLILELGCARIQEYLDNQSRL